MTPLEKSVRNFLIWLRDNEHHEGAWLPEYPQSEERKVPQRDGSIKIEYWPVFTHFRIKGTKQKTVSATVQAASIPFVDLDHKQPERMFYPNEMGLKIASGEIEGGFLK